MGDDGDPNAEAAPDLINIARRASELFDLKEYGAVYSYPSALGARQWAALLGFGRGYSKADADNWKFREEKDPQK